MRQRITNEELLQYLKTLYNYTIDGFKGKRADLFKVMGKSAIFLTILYKNGILKGPGKGDRKSQIVRWHCEIPPNIHMADKLLDEYHKYVRAYSTKYYTSKKEEGPQSDPPPIQGATIRVDVTRKYNVIGTYKDGIAEIILEIGPNGTISPLTYTPIECSDDLKAYAIAMNKLANEILKNTDENQDS